MRRRTVLWICWLSACLAACGSIPETRYFLLAVPDAEPPSENSPSANGWNLGVEVLAVDPPYDQDQLVYRLGANGTEVGFYHYHRWAASLGSLARVALVQGLRGTPGTAVVEPRVATGDYTAILGGRVVQLEEVDLPDGQLVRIELELVLRDGAGQRLWEEAFSRQTKMEVESAAEIAEQMRRDFAALVAEVRETLRTFLGG